MELTRKQFDVLVALIDGKKSQRELEVETGYSLGTINKIISELNSAGYLKDKKTSPEGLLALEPFRVKRAVFIAAGFGSRLVPITLNTPKPLVRVNGTRIIDTLLDALIEADITDITYHIIRHFPCLHF